MSLTAESRPQHGVLERCGGASGVSKKADPAVSLIVKSLLLISRLDAHTGPVNVVRYNHGAKYCLSGSRDRSIRLWNPSLGKEIKCYQGHAQEVLALDM